MSYDSFMKVFDAIYSLTPQEVSIFKETFMENRNNWVDPSGTLLAQRINIAHFITEVLDYSKNIDIASFIQFLAIAQRTQNIWCDVSHVFNKYQSDIDNINDWFQEDWW